jgi:hypothetical protein
MKIWMTNGYANTEIMELSIEQAKEIALRESKFFNTRNWVYARINGEKVEIGHSAKYSYGWCFITKVSSGSDLWREIKNNICNVPMHVKVKMLNMYLEDVKRSEVESDLIDHIEQVLSVEHKSDINAFIESVYDEMFGRNPLAIIDMVTPYLT